MYSNTIVAVAAMASVASANQLMARQHNTTVPVTRTHVVEHFTTFCPEPTTFTVNGKVFEVDEPTTITVEDCPCTVVEAPKHTMAPVPPKGSGVPAPPKGSGVPAPPSGGNTPAPPAGGESPAPPAGGEETPGAPVPTGDVPPASGADVKSEFGVFALIGAAVVGILAL